MTIRRGRRLISGWVGVLNDRVKIRNPIRAAVTGNAVRAVFSSRALGTIVAQLTSEGDVARRALCQSAPSQET